MQKTTSARGQGACVSPGTASQHCCVRHSPACSEPSGSCRQDSGGEVRGAQNEARSRASGPPLPAARPRTMEGSPVFPRSAGSGGG